MKRRVGIAVLGVALLASTVAAAGWVIWPTWVVDPESAAVDQINSWPPMEDFPDFHCDAAEGPRPGLRDSTLRLDLSCVGMSGNLSVEVHRRMFGWDVGMVSVGGGEPF